MKVCNACGQEKSLTDFYGPYTDKSTGRQEWKSPCKACQSEREAVRLVRSSHDGSAARIARNLDVFYDGVWQRSLFGYSSPSDHEQATLAAVAVA